MVRGMKSLIVIAACLYGTAAAAQSGPPLPGPNRPARGVEQGRSGAFGTDWAQPNLREPPQQYRDPSSINQNLRRCRKVNRQGTRDLGCF
jgi:hypothetical protein